MRKFLFSRWKWCKKIISQFRCVSISIKSKNKWDSLHFIWIRALSQLSTSLFCSIWFGVNRDVLPSAWSTLLLLNLSERQKIDCFFFFSFLFFFFLIGVGWPRTNWRSRFKRNKQRLFWRKKNEDLRLSIRLILKE